MKRISSIRNGLAKIEGALGALPPNPGYEGSEDAVHSARTLWWGENPNLVSKYPDAIGINASLEEVADDEVFGVDGGDRGFDPVFEIGAEVDERFPGLGGESGRRIQQSVELHGMEALGWYVPFHHPGLQWGIYTSPH